MTVQNTYNQNTEDNCKHWMVLFFLLDKAIQSVFSLNTMYLMPSIIVKIWSYAKRRTTQGSKELDIKKKLWYITEISFAINSDINKDLKL